MCVCVCVYHSACWWLQPKPEMTVVTGKSLLFSYWQSSRTAPVNMIGGMTDLLATAVQYCMYARGQWVLCLLLVLFECRAGADSKLTQLLRSIILSLQFDCTSICVFHVFFFFFEPCTLENYIITQLIFAVGQFSTWGKVSVLAEI